MTHKPALLLIALLALVLSFAALPAREPAPDAAGQPLLFAVERVADGDVPRLAVLLALRASAWALDAAIAGLANPDASGTPAESAAEGRRSKVSRPLTPFYSFASALPRARGA